MHISSERMPLNIYYEVDLPTAKQDYRSPGIAIQADYQSDVLLLEHGFTPLFYWYRTDYRRKLTVWERLLDSDRTYSGALPRSGIDGVIDCCGALSCSILQPRHKKYAWFLFLHNELPQQDPRYMHLYHVIKDSPTPIFCYFTPPLRRKIHYAKPKKTQPDQGTQEASSSPVQGA